MRDELAAVAGGFAATAGIVLVLFAGDALTGYRTRSFAALAAFVSAQGTPSVGFLLFAAVGVLAWPLVFVSLLEYLPGGTDVVRGAVFGAPLWIGYAVVFGAYTRSPVLFVVVTVVGHLAYGALLGLVYGTLGDHTLPGSS